MIIFWQIVFWVSLAALAHTYLLYPLIMKLLARSKSNNETLFKRTDDLPSVVVLMAAYNEEKVILGKLESLLNQDYPSDKLSFYIGSDNSTDKTNEIILSVQKKEPRIHFFPFNERQGKTSIINHLVAQVLLKHKPNDQLIYLMTDASVMLKAHVTYHLAKHFKNDQMALVDANMNYGGVKTDDISYSESIYLNSEVLLKNHESKVSKKMIGPFGGCYMLRSTYYQSVPNNRLVDDFYIAMNALKKGGLAINSLEAICYESVSHDMSSEYRRKKRIGAGNFQNLLSFASMANPFSSLGFSYISHKVLRWKGPFFLLAMLFSSFGLMRMGFAFFKIVFIAQVFWYILPPLFMKLFDVLKLKSKIPRAITYFNAMNLAMLHGFFKFLGGIQSGIWQPVDRK